MKRILSVVIAVIFATLFIPLIIVSLLSGTNSPGESKTVSVYLKSEDRIEEMDIDQYVKCAVAAEMPADFKTEALKAQTVAVRTYLKSRMDAAQGGAFAEEHKGAAVCDDFAHCQAYLSEEKRRESWGEAADANWDKISAAVDGTDGLIMTYGGEPITAVFHSTSSGRTERAADVWGDDVAYLQSAESEGDMYSPKYTSEVSMSIDEFMQKGNDNIDGVDWNSGLYGNIERSEAGGIKTLDIGGKNISGTELRRIYGLNSTNAEISEVGGNVVFSVKGYGHGVGMSQYGADYLAGQGKSYKEILKNYYKGVKIDKW